MIKISILIPTIEGRETHYNDLVSSLEKQYNGDEVEICTLKDNREMTIGEKRNKLLAMAKGEWLCFVDDDDKISDNYISLLLDAVKSDCDCASLKGEYAVDGVFDGIFEHSLKYDEWKTNDNGSEIKYIRTPNHLSLIRSSIAKQFDFPEKNFSEDFAWSTKIYKSGLLKTEHYISEILYHYNYVSNK